VKFEEGEKGERGGLRGRKGGGKIGDPGGGTARRVDFAKRGVRLFLAAQRETHYDLGYEKGESRKVFPLEGKGDSKKTRGGEKLTYDRHC